MRKLTPELRNGLCLIATVLWLASVGFGMTRLWVYASTPGEETGPPPTWPADCDLERSPGQFTLLVFIHPHCPCTRATLGELDQVMSVAKGKASAHLLILSPEGMPTGWEHTPFWSSGQALPATRVTADRGGTEAQRFHARTSGQVIAYAPDGQLVFHGGITPIRNHVGDNLGRQALLALISGQSPVVSQAPVFGCPLQDPAPEASTQP